MEQDRCMGCMEMRGESSVCPFCGYVEGTRVALPTFLRPRTLLRGRYLVGRVLGHGGFGITYIGWDTVLGVKLALKEFFPKDCAVRAEGATEVKPYSGELGEKFEEGLRSFLTEARTLARFEGHPNIVGVRDFFPENGTAYLVMRYLEGCNLREHLKRRGGKLPWNEALSIMVPAMEALMAIHAQGVLHRDVSPDNIFITRSGEVKILDFGAARQALGQSISLSVILKPGYAPEEQYRSHGQQGPWSDVYAAAATLYRCVTGKVPPESLDRLAEDTLRPPSELDVDIAPAAEAALLKGMALRAADRYAGMSEFLVALLTDAQGETVALPGPSAPQRPAVQSPRPAFQQVAPQQPSPSQAAARYNSLNDDLMKKYEKRRTGGKQKRVPGRGDALRAVILVLLVFGLVGGGIWGGAALLRKYSGGYFNIGLNVTGKPTATPSPAPASPRPAGTPKASAEATKTPEATASATPGPDETPGPTPTPPPPKANEVITQGGGARSSQASSSFLANPGTQIVRYEDGEYTARVVAQLAPGVSSVLTVPSDANGAMNGPGYVEHQIKRDTGLYIIPDSDVSHIELVLPETPRVGTVWTLGSTTCQIIAVNEFLSLSGTDYMGAVEVQVDSSNGREVYVYVPGIGLHTIFAERMFGVIKQSVVSVIPTTPDGSVALQQQAQNTAFAR